MNYIIRDHNRERFDKRKEMMVKIVDHLNFVYGKGAVTLELKDQYYNMKEKVESEFYIVELAMRAIEATGVKARTIPIRGGTDGSRLSYMGLPCPNIFGGGHNFHSRFEFIPVQSMEKAVEVIVRIAEMNAKKPS
jgi:tripeptide aminopeptidase